jgi:hypothetical protein
VAVPHELGDLKEIEMKGGMKGNRTLELVVFELAKGVTNEEFLKTVGPVSQWVKTQPGFVSRDLVRDTEGNRWVEIVWWDSLEQAKVAAEAAMTSEACAPMFSKIDFENIQMLHGTQAISEVRPVRAAA